MTKFKPLSKQLAMVVVAAIVVVVVMAHVSSSIIFNTLSRVSHEATVAMVVRLVEQTIQMQDNAQKLLEERTGEKMQKAMNLLQASYVSHKGNVQAIDLEDIIAKVGGELDLFIVNPSHTVVHTNFAKDLGLVIGKGDFALFLSGVLASGEYVRDRPMLSSNDGMKQFAYQATKDRKYLLEVGVPFHTSEGAHVRLAFQSLARNIVGDGSQIKGVEIYAQHHSTDFINICFPSLMLPPGERLQAATRAVQENLQQNGYENGRQYHYMPIVDEAGQSVKRVVELEINNSGWDALLMRHRHMQMLVYALLILVGIAFSLWIASTIARPISRLSSAVSKIAAGDLSTEVVKTSNDEVGLLSENIDLMRISIAELLAKLKTANQDLSVTYELTIRAFLNALKFNESSTADHSLHVNMIAMTIGKHMGLSKQQLVRLEWGSLLHDIGKLAIPNRIILKQGALTPEERIIVNTHPETAYQMLKEATFLNDALQVALCHHECYNGEGYPQGLKGEAIPLLARVCTVADAYEAMTAKRSYRHGLTHEEAMVEIARFSGTQFDPNIVDVFLKISRDEYSYAPLDGGAGLPPVSSGHPANERR